MHKKNAIPTFREDILFFFSSICRCYIVGIHRLYARKIRSFETRPLRVAPYSVFPYDNTQRRWCDAIYGSSLVTIRKRPFATSSDS